MEFAGFWERVIATIIDNIIIMALTYPIINGIYSPNSLFGELIIYFILPGIGVIAFWVHKSATPGKMAMNIIIVDQHTLQPPTTDQFIKRYIGYLVSCIPLGLGYIWVAFDKQKQGWHDKIGSTIVVKNKKD